VNDLLGRHFARLHPLSNLREQGVGHCHQAVQRGDGALFDSSAAGAHLRHHGLRGLVQLGTLRDDLGKNLLLLRFRFGKQMMLFDTPVDRLGLRDPRFRRLHPPGSELL
jgi:hypothetical protein